MAASIVNLGNGVFKDADKLLFGMPDWSAIHSDTATALSCGAAAVANEQHFATRLTLSYSAAPAVSVLTIKDGSVVLWQAEISATGPFVYDFEFKRPLRARVGQALTANVGSAGGAVVQTLILQGFTSWVGTQVSV